jgi:Protein of unknown function (DUF559)
LPPGSKTVHNLVAKPLHPAVGDQIGAVVVALAAGPGAVLSHRVAGKLHRLDGTPQPVRLDVSVPQPRRPRNVRGANIHRTWLTADDITMCDGYTVMLGEQFVARVDMALPHLRLAIEADGYATHALRPGFERDRERAALLQLAGWSVLSFTANQIRRRPE